MDRKQINKDQMGAIQTGNLARGGRTKAELEDLRTKVELVGQRTKEGWLDGAGGMDDQGVARRRRTKAEPVGRRTKVDQVGQWTKVEPVGQRTKMEPVGQRTKVE